MADLLGIFGTLQLNGSVTDPICYIQLPTIPPRGTIMALPGEPPAYYRVLDTLLVVKPITDLTLAAMLERVEATGERVETLSNRCIVFVEPWDPESGMGLAESPVSSEDA